MKSLTSTQWWSRIQPASSDAIPFHKIGLVKVHRNSLCNGGLTRNLGVSAISSSGVGKVAFLRCEEPEVQIDTLNVTESYWIWKGHRIHYSQCGDSGPSVILIHGFGGNSNHWRKNIQVLAQSCRVYALDLLGYGGSDKPDPRSEPPNSLYTFDVWGEQVLDFISQVALDPCFLICNSIGGVVGLQAGLTNPSLVRGVQLLDVSLRKLHLKNQSPFARPFIKAFQDLLYNTPFGGWFFSQVANPQGVETVLKKAYCDATTVTDELVDMILKPGLEQGALDVFLSFISYSDGPLPDEQLAAIDVPVSILWGQEDPWERIEYGRPLGDYKSVEEFVELPGVGHCPQDEAPDTVNPLIKRFILRHYTE